VAGGGADRGIGGGQRRGGDRGEPRHRWRAVVDVGVDRGIDRGRDRDRDLAVPQTASIHPPADPPRSVEASGDRSVAVGGNAGWISTGDNAAAPQNPPVPPPSTSSPAAGSVTAGGARSAAVGGDAGAITTGDQ